MWTWLKDAVFALLNAVYGLCGDWGLAIIIITIIFRVLIFPISAKQIKSSFTMSQLQPKIKELQIKYADDKQRLSEETMKVYADHKYNPLSGCLPMLLQMPIFIILFEVLRGYLPKEASFYTFIANLTIAPKDVFSFTPEGIIATIPYILLVLIFSVSTLIPMLLQKNAEQQVKTMGIFMSIFMLWIGWTSPAGVLLYWDISSIFGISQQLISQKLLTRKFEEEHPVEVEPVHIEVERKVKKTKPTKK